MQKRTTTILTIAVVALGMFILWLASQSGALFADAGAADRAPAFEGEEGVWTLQSEPDLTQIIRISPRLPAGGVAGTVMFSDTFESGLNQTVWTSVDNDGTTNGEYKWGLEVYTPTASSGSNSVWAVGDGVNGAGLDPATDGYPNNVDSWLILGELDLSETSEAFVEFTYWLESDNGDIFGVAASTNGTVFNGLQTTSGGGGGFSTVSHDLGAYVGEETVYVGFFFTSDSTDNSADKKGAFVDDVSINVQPLAYQFLSMMRFDPTPTPTATPIPEDYRDDFNGPGTGWEMRRTDITNSSDWSISYADQSLLLDIESANNYLLVSPLQEAPPVPYAVEARVDFRGDNVYDQHGYGIVFGGNKSGDPCPAGDYSTCFTQFYWLHLRYRQDNSDEKLELQLKRVTGFNSSNDPITEPIWGWVAPNDLANVSLPVNDWITWRIEIESDGDIVIRANNQHVQTIDNAPNLLQNLQAAPYFGLMSNVANLGDSTTQFDFIDVEATD